MLMLLAAWTIFYRLDAVPMNLWDESRQANNAMEMYLSNNWLFSTYDAKPDFWNTKPHLLVMLQAFCMKIFGGPSLSALRLPSAIAGMLTVFVWFIFIFKRHGYAMAALWVLIILSCGGFNAYHITRTGDYDALLTLFISLANIHFFKIFSGELSTKKLWVGGLWLALAFLAKSMAMLIWIPGWALAWLIFRQYKKLVWKDYSLAAAIPTAVAAIYWLWQNSMNPGYLQAVFANDVSGRYFSSNEGHGYPWWYYFQTLWNDYFRWFTPVLPLVLLIPGISALKKELKFTIAAALFFLIFLSVSQTRIWWYLAPVIPMLAYWACLPLANQLKQPKLQRLTLLWLILASMPGYYLNYHKNTTSHGVRPALVLMNAEKNSRLPFDAHWQTAGYFPIEKYYREVLSRKGLNLKLSQEFGNYSIKDTIVVSHMEHLDSLGKLYKLKQHHYPTDDMPVWVMVVDSVLNKQSIKTTETP